ncbi:DEKNAAC104900 [Brettanomyces naardenensis]|uniref:RING-type E3 ubiquitin transferase n=1 Tax=Brettanomyces naardenensis TaxID=13370 RepID=A0A448YSG3_BRENA|nr:DEKNAAC104900 [Brettanomyces naardenensis]
MSSAEEIRAKRLARLTAATQQPTEEKKSVSKVQPKGKENVKEISPTTTTGTSSMMPERKTRKVKKQEDIDEWINNQLERILQVTFSPSKSESGKLFLLTADDTTEGSRLTFDTIDPALLEVLTEQGVKKLYATPFKYLFSVWSRADSARRVIRSDDPLGPVKAQTLNEIIRLSSSYSSIMFQVPDMFVDEVNLDQVVDELWRGVNVYESFLIDIIARATENDSTLDLLNAVIPKLTVKLQKLEYSGDTDYLKILTVIQVFLSNKTVALHFHEVNGYHPEGLKGVEFENKTLLGQILRISPLLPAIAVSNYPDTLTKPMIMKTHESLQAEHSIMIGRLFSICDTLVRAGGEARQEFLKWMADVVNNNHLRRGEHAKPEKLASDSLMLNLTLILVRFSQPFLGAGGLGRINKISQDYLNHRNKLIALKDETRINATLEEYNEYYTDDKLVDSPMNFISECFYLLLTYLQYGLGGLFVSADRLGNYIKQMSQQLKKLEEMMQRTAANSSNPLMKMLYDTKVKPLKKELEKYKARKLSIEMFFSNRTMQLDVFEIIIGCITFFVKLIDPTHKYPEEPLKVPLHDFEDNTEKMEDIEYTRTLAPVPFRYYPEMFLEGIINYCHYVSRYNNNPMFQNEDKLDRFVEFAVVILRCPELVSNPHLKARLTEVMFFGSLPLQNGRNGYMVEVFNNNSIVKKNLMVSLLDFYVMVEKTGASSQFYDKFNSRYHISFILEQLWKFDYFKRDLQRISQQMPQLFIRLIARMLNDTTYLLDESLNHLHTIGTCQREIEHRQKGGQPTNDDSDEELKKKLEDSERMAKSFVQLSNKTVLLFDLFTKETPRSFVMVELADRLAGMLDYNLVALVGPKYNELRVKNPEAYQFSPGELLFQLCSIFINLANEQEFVDAVARDERSFRPECFKKATDILYKVGKIPNKQFESTLLGFAKRAETKKREEEEEELEMGDVPDEFLDPLMFTLMKDPVKLPHSKVSIDRSVLKAHLMNDPTDPFNRTPLKLEDVADDVELRDKIQTWIKTRKAAIRKEKQLARDADGDTDMT